MNMRYIKCISALAVGRELHRAAPAGQFQFPVGIMHGAGLPNAASEMFDHGLGLKVSRLVVS